MSELINLIQGFRDLKENSQIKDFLADNPDWATNPDKLTQALSISPRLGMQLVDRSPVMGQIRAQMAAQKGKWLMQAGDAALSKFMEVAKPSEPQGPEDAAMGLSMPPNYAAAREAANAEYQNRLLAADEVFGHDFGNGLRQMMPAWSVDKWSRLRPGLDTIMGASKRLFNVRVPDDKGGYRWEEKSFLPGDEQAYADRTGYLITEPGKGKDVPGGMITLQPNDPRIPQQDGKPLPGTYQLDTSTGKVEPVIGPEVIANMTDSLSKDYAQQSQGFLNLQQDYGDLLTATQHALKGGDPAAAQTAVIKYVHMHMPQISPTGAAIDQAIASQMLSPEIANLWGLIKTGQVSGPATETLLRSMAREGASMYANAVKSNLPIRQNAYQKALSRPGIDPNLVVNGVPIRQGDFDAQLQAIEGQGAMPTAPEQGEKRENAGGPAPEPKVPATTWKSPSGKTFKITPGAQPKIPSL